MNIHAMKASAKNQNKWTEYAPYEIAMAAKLREKSVAIFFFEHNTILLSPKHKRYRNVKILNTYKTHSFWRWWVWYKNVDPLIVMSKYIFLHVIELPASILKQLSNNSEDGLLRS